MQNTVEFGGFSIDGAGKAGGMNLNLGGGQWLSTIAFRDIGIYRCATNPPIKMNRVILCTFENLQISEPVGATAMDIPYVLAQDGCNGNRFIGIGLRGTSTTSNVGVSGAIRIEKAGTYPPSQNLLLHCWDEFLHVPENGSIVNIQGNVNTISDWATFDSNATSKNQGNSCWFRFRAVDGQNQDIGGNWVRSLIPGRYDVDQNQIAFGCILEQSRNRLEGVIGYNGYCILLKPGIDYTWVRLGGRESGVASGPPAIVNLSGATNNSLS